MPSALLTPLASGRHAASSGAQASMRTPATGTVCAVSIARVSITTSASRTDGSGRGHS
jgi:hypothetical protein